MLNYNYYKLLFICKKKKKITLQIIIFYVHVFLEIIEHGNMNFMIDKNKIIKTKRTKYVTLSCY